MENDKKENDCMNGYDDFMAMVGKNVKSAVVNAINEKKRTQGKFTQEMFYNLVEPGNGNKPSDKKNTVSVEWKKGKRLYIKTLYKISNLTGVKMSDFFNVEVPGKERSLADWCKTLFVDMPESFDVDWDVTQIDGDWETTHDRKRISITLTFPMEIVHDEETGYPVGYEDTVLFSELWKCAQTIKEIKNCTFLSNEEKREKALREIDELENRLNDDIPF